MLPRQSSSGFFKMLHSSAASVKIEVEGRKENAPYEGTGTDPKKTYTIPFPGSTYRSSLYSGAATIGVAADVRVQKRDNITRMTMLNSL